MDARTVESGKRNESDSLEKPLGGLTAALFDAARLDGEGIDDMVRGLDECLGRGCRVAELEPHPKTFLAVLGSDSMTDGDTSGGVARKQLDLSEHRRHIESAAVKDVLPGCGRAYLSPWKDDSLDGAVGFTSIDVSGSE